MAINYKKMDYYLNLPWTYTISTDKKEDGEVIYVVHVNELPRLCTDGRTIDEAMENIKEAMEGTFELYMDFGEEIPEPLDESKYKGNIAYRTSSQRHHRIAKEAQRKGLSLSQTIDQLIDSSFDTPNKVRHSG